MWTKFLNYISNFINSKITKLVEVNVDYNKLSKINTNSDNRKNYTSNTIDKDMKLLIASKKNNRILNDAIKNRILNDSIKKSFNNKKNNRNINPFIRRKY